MDNNKIVCQYVNSFEELGLDITLSDKDFKIIQGLSSEEVMLMALKTAKPYPKETEA